MSELCCWRELGQSRSSASSKISRAKHTNIEVFVQLFGWAVAAPVQSLVLMAVSLCKA